MKKLIILVSGKLRSGKNTFSDFLKEEIESQYKIPVATDFFARLLKDMCKDAFRPLIDFLNEELKELIDVYDTNVGAGEELTKLLITKDENWFENKNEITRHILQIVGTDIVRNVNENFWSESFVKRANERQELLTINTDCRFKSEIEHVEKNFDTIKIRVERKMDREGSINEHVSETALDDYQDWDYIVYNDGTLDELKKEVEQIAKDIFKCAK